MGLFLIKITTNGLKLTVPILLCPQNLRKATNENYALVDEAAMMPGRRVAPGTSGRPSQK